MKKENLLLNFSVGLLWTIIAVGPGVYGLKYYTTGMHDRAYMEIHEMLNPT